MPRPLSTSVTPWTRCALQASPCTASTVPCQVWASCWAPLADLAELLVHMHKPGLTAAGCGSFAR